MRGRVKVRIQLARKETAHRIGYIGSMGVAKCIWVHSNIIEDVVLRLVAHPPIWAWQQSEVSVGYSRAN
jgi:hypothetical protein